MKYNSPDVDIDLQDRAKAIALLGGIPAAIIKDNKASKHNTGMYYISIPTDPMTGIASIDHKAAEERGYFKIDFLNLGIYDHVQDEQHLDLLTQTQPNYARLTTDPEFVSKIIHIGNYYDLLTAMKPTRLAEMAMLLAIIRPGKKHLKFKPWSEVEADVWTHVDDGYSFKKSHSFSYAMAVAVHMNLIEQAENE
jgi:DNA polymerase III alpha subunit